MYGALKLTSPTIKDYSCDGASEIYNLSQINIFIGPNNSGKSKFMRTLFIDKSPIFIPRNFDVRTFNIVLSDLKNGIQHYYNKQGIQKVGVVDLNKLQPVSFFYQGSHSIGVVKYIIDLSTITVNNTVTWYRPGNAENVQIKIRDLADFALRSLRDMVNAFHEGMIPRENIYIPTLRGLRGNDYKDGELKIKGNDTYAIRTIKDYFSEETELSSKIYTGLKIFEDVKRHLLGNTEQREKMKKFETFLSEAFFESKGITIIPNIDDDVVHVKIGDDKDFPIHQLGEGIQSIIILTYPLFFNEGKKLSVFYEEPDLFLHPGFQRIFLETLSREEFKDYQFFMTTHSNHFLDMTLDFSSISVYAFSKNNDSTFSIKNVDNDDKNILELLGIKNSSVFLSNCTIWVEGITDRIYLRKYLELYQQEILNRDNRDKKYLEDIHYSFVEYGGSNITHWSFLDDEDDDHPNINVEKLCAKLFLISDRDKTKPKKNGEKSKKQIRQDKLSEVLDDRFYLLKALEIENLLSKDIIVKVVSKLEKDSSLVNVDSFHEEKYKQEYLGKYIDEKITGKQKMYKKSDGDTIKEKVLFAKNAVEEIQNYDDLSEEAKDLAKKLYDFIRSNNG